MGAGKRLITGLLGLASFGFLTSQAFALDPNNYTTLFGFELGKSTFADVQKNLGNAPVSSRYAGGCENEDLYYVTKDDSTILNFFAGTETESDPAVETQREEDNETSGFRIFRSNQPSPLDSFYSRYKPFKITKTSDQIKINGVYLGMSRESFDELFNAKVVSSENFVKTKSNKEGQYTNLVYQGLLKKFSQSKNKILHWDDDVEINARFDKGGLCSFGVTRTLER